MLQTGVMNHRAGLGNMPETIPDAHRGQPGYDTVMNHRVVTIAELLRAAGYRTYLTGKWHLGSDPARLPEARGYDRGLLRHRARHHRRVMRARGLFALAAGLFLAAFGRDRVDLWIDDTRLPPLALATSVQVLDREGALLRRLKAFDRHLGLEGAGAVGVLEAGQQPRRRMRARVAGAGAGGVFGVATRDVGGHARVDAAVDALDQVDEPGHGRRREKVAALSTAGPRLG